MTTEKNQRPDPPPALDHDPDNDQLQRLTQIIAQLRGENGCPWDKKQTPQSMIIYLIEEVYELIDALRNEDTRLICEELGDVLFHLLFISAIYNERAAFDLNDVARHEADKMVRRHPHVFGDKTAETVADIKKQWHSIKKEEKGKNVSSSILDSVPKSVPPLVRAYRLTERAARVGFDWENIAGVMTKAKEELVELEGAMAAENPEKISEEFGDLLFSVVNLCRRHKVDPEQTLRDASGKFARRFRDMERRAREAGGGLAEMSDADLDRLWEDAKQNG